MKASLLDMPVMIATLFALVIVGFLTIHIHSEFRAAFEENFDLTEDEEEMWENTGNALSLFVSLFPMVVISIGIGAIVSAFFIPSHPVFFPVSIITNLIFVVLSVMFSDILWEFMTDARIVAIANEFPLTVALVQYFPIIISAFGFLTAIFMYSKRGDYY